ncbi:MAG: DnaD domain protein [Chloroflexi bacterium]|nr:DnaD domain protein [Chloroflexota bacterium]
MSGGFPRGVQFTPVPDPLLASLLEEIDSLDELKVTLRVIHALHRQRKVPSSITRDELYSDRTVAAMLGVSGDELETAVDAALKAASERGVLLVRAVPESSGSSGASPAGERIYLNTEPVRRALVRQGIDPAASKPGESGRQRETWPDTGAALPKLSAITFYEQNIAPVTALVAENIHSALEEHPEDEVLLAIRTAAEANVRSWKYIAAILRRWAIEGRPEELEDEGDGTARRDLEEDRSDEFYEEYLKRQRARGAH